MNKSDIVFGSEFSPAVIELPKLLELVKEYEPERRVLQQAIDETFFKGKGKTKDPKKTLGDNTILSMVKYGLIEKPETEKVQFTPFGSELYGAREDKKKLAELMGKRVLVDLNGLLVVECIQNMIQADQELKKETIAHRLRQEGLHVPKNGKHLNIMRQWLQYAGVLNASESTGRDMWTPDDDRINELLGITIEDIDKWGELTRPQYDFARAFSLMGVDSSVSSKVRDAAVEMYGTEFPEGGLPQSVLHKLEEVGLITWEKVTEGRGAKAHKISPTAKLQSEFLDPILEQIAHDMGPGYKRLSRMSLENIVSNLESEDKHEKGIALEALAFYFSRRLDLQFVKWRLMGSAAGGAEVDMIVEGARLLFSRWQIQCKNTKKVSTDDLAKEVGVATAIRSGVILLISTGDIGPTVHKFAKKVMENTAMQIVLIDGKILKELTQDPEKLTAELSAQAINAMTIKRVQLED